MNVTAPTRPTEKVTEPEHRVAPDAGMNVRCICGAEYSLTSNLRRHIARETQS